MDNRARDTMLPDWKIKAISLTNKDLSGTTTYTRQFWAQTGERLVRSKSGAAAVLVKNRTATLTAGEETSLFLDGAAGAILMATPWVGVKAKLVRLQTDPHGLVWNGKILNPKLYQLNDKDFQLEASIRVWVPPTEKREGYWKRVQSPIRPFLEPSEDPAYLQLLKELGIP